MNEQEQPLNQKQKLNVEIFREKIRMLFIAETEAFYKIHPELRLQWDFNVKAVYRDGYAPLYHEEVKP